MPFRQPHTCCGADDRAGFATLFAPVYRLARETMPRVPLADWYDTMTGRQRGFQARSVVGGIYIKLLSERMKAEHPRLLPISSR